MLALEDVSTFDFSRNDEDDGAVAHINNLDATIQVSPIPTIRIHKDHPLDQVIGDLQSATQTRKMSKKLKEHGFVSTIHQRTNHKGLQNCLFACFLSQKNPKRAIATQVEGIDNDEVIAPVARIEAIRLFLAYASFKDFVVYQMDVKSTFLYEKIEEEVYVCQPSGFEDPDFLDRVYKISSMGELTFFLGLQVKQKKDGISISQDKYVAEILKKFGFIEVRTTSTSMETQKPLLKDKDGEEVDVHMYSDYAGASLDRKSTRGGYQFLGCRLISWLCKKQTVVANSTTEAKYMVALSCHGQVLWIQNQLLDYA
nr:hypothetical protein [Tanacetum cinerariifolium]